MIFEQTRRVRSSQRGNTKCEPPSRFNGMVRTLARIPGYHLSEKLHNGSRTLVCRGYREIDSLPVVIKLLKNAYPSFSELVKFRNQYTIAKNLNSPVIVQTYSLEPYQNSYALVMEDFGGISLKEWRMRGKQQFLQEFLEIAIALCNALDVLHQERIIHKDIKPSNILINPETKKVKLIDFSIASLLPRETQTLVNPNVLEGTLAYISPEQTGRMNRGIDYRSDFYSVGVTFYELLTGELPFKTNDVMELVHCHIAKIPPLFDHNKNIPQVLCEIVIRLMAKNAEDRYQSALGLKYDLELCLNQYKNSGKIEIFEIGERDLCDRFLIPEKLYGRDKEVQQLLAAFERVAQGSSELMLVSGFSGIGKTAVVNEIHKPIVKQRGYFIKGKFDQFNRDLPISGFVLAFQDLMMQLLTESDKQLKQWKNNILEALGENGQVIIEVIPELEKIIDQQLPTTELSGTAAQNRFQFLFQKFIQVFATKEHPLVIFLDDLQWADSASVKLIQFLLTSQKNNGCLLLLGAYRDNEVSPAHCLMLALEEISKFGTKINTITLNPLNQKELNQLVADTLSCSESLALPLSKLIYLKTQGNPFFVTQFLKALHHDGLIYFNFEVGCWQCDITQINQQALTDDIVEFMAIQLRRLPESTQQVLQLAACIGNQFDLATLAIVSAQSEIKTAANIWKALQEGVILPTTEVYKFYVGQEDQAVAQEVFQTVTYKFLHDRVQQAAYSLIPTDERQAVHLKVGQLLLGKTPEAKREERIFEIVTQLNIAVALITRVDERQALAQFNLMASRKAKAATAYRAALKYAHLGIHLLAQNSWQFQYELTLALYQIATESAYLSGELEQMQTFARVILNHAKTSLDQIDVYKVKIESFTSQGQFAQAIGAATAILEQLGVDLPAEPSKNDVEAAFGAVSDAIGERSPAELINLPETMDAEILAATRILISVSPAAFMSQPLLYLLVVLRRVYLYVVYGNESMSSSGYASYGILISGVIGNVELGYEFGQLALDLLSRQQNSAFKGKTFFPVYGFTRHWKMHLRDSLNPLQIAYSSSLDVGDLAFAGYSASMYGFYSYFSGQNLTQLESEMTVYCEALTHLKQNTTLRYCQLVRQILLNLVGNGANVLVLSGVAYDEQQQIPLHEAVGDQTGLAFLWIHKLVLSYLFSAFEQAVQQAQQAKRYLDAVLAQIFVPIFYFYESLAQLALFRQLSPAEHQQMEERIAANQKKLNYWAVHAPMNFRHKFDLVEAEHHRILSQRIEAMDLYDRAIAGAKANGFTQEEALSNELAARFYLDWGKEKVAQAYMQEAYYCYARWGAKAKVADLESRYPQLLSPILQQTPSPFLRNDAIFALSSVTTTSLPTINSSSVSVALDLAAILKASQTISCEIELEKLLSSLLHIVIENAGADKCVLMLMESDNLLIRALAGLDLQSNRNAKVDFSSMLTNPQPVEESRDVSVTLINTVQHSLQAAVIVDARVHPQLINDPYIQQQQPKSILCSPILHQGKLLGVLYLENNLATGAFTSDRVELLNLLCAQAAISLENARLYQDSLEYAQQLEESLAERQQKSLELETALQKLQHAQLQVVQSEKMSALGNLVAGVAHEMNNPLGFIAASLQQAKPALADIFEHLKLYEEKFSTPGDEITDHAKKIDLEYTLEDLPKMIYSMTMACDRLENISTSLRTFSRADRDYKVPFNIHEGIDSTILILTHRLKANAQRSAIEVVTNYGNLPQVECFPGQLNQVFMNILANSIDALDELNTGRRSFQEIQANPNRIIITTSLKEQQVEVKIADNGIGMSESVKQKIFDHLFTTKSVGKGTGLGLAIAQSIVREKHGGTLNVNSTLGEGTEFVITLPILAQTSG